MELGNKTSIFLPSLTSVTLALFQTLLVRMSLKTTLVNSVPVKHQVGLAHFIALILLKRICIY